MPGRLGTGEAERWLQCVKGGGAGRTSDTDCVSMRHRGCVTGTLGTRIDALVRQGQTASGHVVRAAVRAVYRGPHRSVPCRKRRCEASVKAKASACDVSAKASRGVRRAEPREAGYWRHASRPPPAPGVTPGVTPGAARCPGIVHLPSNLLLWIEKSTRRDKCPLCKSRGGACRWKDTAQCQILLYST